MSTDTAIRTCDWCDRPATRGFGPATGATHHICSVHDAAPDLLEALKAMLKAAPQSSDTTAGHELWLANKLARDAIALTEEEKWQHNISEGGVHFLAANQTCACKNRHVYAVDAVVEEDK